MRGIIVAAQPEAAEAGAAILAKGGNAADAAVACALVQGVVDPQMVGIAGFGTAQIYMPDRNVHDCIDFHARCPSAATSNMWEDILVGETSDGFGFIVEGKVNDAGYGSIAVPGSLRAYEDLANAYGTMDWKDLVQPAIERARKGFIVRPNVRSMWIQKESRFGRVDMVDKLSMTATGRSVYFGGNGRLLDIGDLVVNPDLAATLETIGLQGADAFYSGSIGERIAADMDRNGGLLSYDDLRTYRTTRTSPLRGQYRGNDIATCNPPGGGIALIEVLNFLENFDLRGLGHNEPEYLCVLGEALKLALRDKDRHVGDPAFVEVPTDRLISKSYAADAARTFREGERIRVERMSSGESQNTTQLCVVDSGGAVVTMTHSLGTASGIITDGLGFMYNACMNVFDPRPGRPGSIAPGKSRYTAMAPSLVFDRDGLKMALGAPGGTHITSALVQAVANVIDFGMSIVEAVVAPRISVTSNRIDFSNRIPEQVSDSVRAQGYTVSRSPLSYAFGAPHALLRKEGGWSGGADPQRDGVAIEVR